MNKINGSLLIFCNSVPSCRSIHSFLTESGFDVVSFHGDVPNKLRITNFDQFKTRMSKIMICTDLASRGLDFSFLTHVFNFDFPMTTSDYLHRYLFLFTFLIFHKWHRRAGRAGRAGRKGWVISLYQNKDNALISDLNESYNTKTPINIKGSQYT